MALCSSCGDMLLLIYLGVLLDSGYISQIAPLKTGNTFFDFQKRSHNSLKQIVGQCSFWEMLVDHNWDNL